MPGETHVPDEYICWGLSEAELCYLWLSKVDFTVLACQSAMCLQTKETQISYIEGTEPSRGIFLLSYIRRSGFEKAKMFERGQ